VQAFESIKTYDFGTWMIGIMRSFLSGGAAALGGITGSGIAGLNLRQTLIVTGSGFVVMGLYRLGEFLQLHGAPDKIQQALTVAENKAKETVAAVKDAKAAAPTQDKE
jgi:hypothetical protein